MTNNVNTRPPLKFRGAVTLLGEIIALGVLIAACGDDSSSSNPPEDSSTSTASIIIADFDFGEPLSVGVGTIVEVTNADGVGHTWTDDGGAFDSGFLEPDASFELTVERAGTISFSCKIHPSMTGTLTVTG